MKSMWIRISLTLVACSLLQAAALSGESLQVTHEVRFSLAQLTFDKIDGYDVILLQDGLTTTDVGKPMLPVQELWLALPAGMQVTKVRVENIQTESVAGEFVVYPVQPPRALGPSDQPASFVQPDSAVYSSSRGYPAEPAEYVRESDLAGQELVEVQIRPVQYIPNQQRLLLHTSLTVVVEGTAGHNCGDYLSPHASPGVLESYRDMVEGMVANPEAVSLREQERSGAATLPAGGPYDHVVITPQNVTTGFQALIDWHNQTGIRDTVVTVEWIYANYSGADNAQKIRNFIIDANATWGTLYFLLGGEHELIPFVFRLYYGDENTPSDQYYTDFDDDWTTEVLVGRLPIANASGAAQFVTRLLEYEQSPPRTDYAKDVLLIGMDLDASTHTEQLMQNIAGLMPADFAFSKVYDSDASNHRTATLAALNAGRHLVSHSDHSNIDVMGTGYVNHNWSIYNSDVNALSNGERLSIVVSNGCEPNHMDASECIAERFVERSSGGGIAFIGNTRSGWYNPGNPLALSDALNRQCFAAIFSRDKSTLGEILADSKLNFSSSGSVNRQCLWTFNLLGEPRMTVWTNDPATFTVTCPSSRRQGQISPLPVHVVDSATGAPVEQASVTLWKKGEVVLTQLTDASGNVSLAPGPLAAGTVYVTVTKRNYIPKVHPVSVLQYVCGDADGGGQLNVSDAVYTVSYVFSPGSPAPNPMEAGDVTCEGKVNISDAVYVINYIFVPGSPAPCANCR